MTVAQRRARPRLSPDLGLGIAMGLANAIGYVFVLLLSHALGREDFGAFGSLNTIALLLAIPAGAFQVVTARHVAHPERQGTGLTQAVGVGAGLTALAAAGAWPLVHLLHLPSAAAPLLMAAGILPMTVTGVFQGVLLGERRMGALAGLYVVTALTRLTAALIAIAVDADLSQVFALMLGASILSAGWGGCHARHGLRTHGAADGAEIIRDLLRSNSTLAALIALSSADVVLARHVLTDHGASGDYAFAAVFGKAVFWGTQFVALTVVPVVHGSDARRRLARAAALVTGLGAAATLAVAITPDLLLRAVGGAQFVGAPDLLVPFTTLGTLWALGQLWLFAEMGHGRARLGAITWAVTLVEIAVVLLWARDSPGQVITTALVAAAVVVVAGAVDLMRPATEIDDVPVQTTHGAADPV